MILSTDANFTTILSRTNLIKFVFVSIAVLIASVCLFAKGSQELSKCLARYIYKTFMFSCQKFDEFFQGRSIPSISVTLLIAMVLPTVSGNFIQWWHFTLEISSCTLVNITLLQDIRAFHICGNPSIYILQDCAVGKIDSKSLGFSSSTLTLLVPGDDFGRTVNI